MPADKLRNQQRSATVALKIRKTKAETLKRSKTSWVNDIFSDDINRQLAGISQVRKLIDMSMTKHGPGLRLSNLVGIKLSILDRELSAFVPRFIKFLSNNDSWQLQVEAAWVITELHGLYHENWMIPSLTTTTQYIPTEWGLGRVIRTQALPLPERVERLFPTMIPSLVEPIFQKLYTNQESLEVLVAGILSNHTLPQSIATKQFRTLLSINKTLHLCKATKFSVIHRFAQFIKMTSVPQQLRDDSAWILVLIFSLNLAHIFDMDEYELVVEAVVKLLDFPDKSLCEKALLVVGDIATGDCDCLLDCEALTPLLNKLKEANNNLPMQREVTRILSMIFESKSDLQVTSAVTSAVHVLLELLRSDDVDVLTNVCCALSYCIDGIHHIVKHQNSFDLIFGQLVGLLRHESCSVTIPVLKIVVRILATKEKSRYCKFNLADLDCLVTLLDNHNEDGHVVTYICSIMCGVVECGNMEAVITAGFMKKLVNLIQTVKVGKSDRDREELNYTAVATINFAIARGNDAQIKYLVDISCIEVLCDFIASCWSDDFMKGSCESLEKILQLGVPSIDYARRIEKKVKSIHFCSYYRWYFDEFLLKLDKCLGRSKQMNRKDMF